VIQSGRLGLIRDSELRAAPGGIDGLYADADEERVRDFALRDDIARRSPAGTIMAILDGLPGWGSPGVGAGPRPLSDFRRDPELVDQVLWRSFIQRRYVLELETVQMEYARITELIHRSRR